MPNDRDNKMEFAARLMTHAFGRFNDRRSYEWKVCFGIWTAFGVATGIALNAEPWEAGNASFAICVVCVVSALVIVVVFAGVWTPFIVQAHERDKRDAYFWECTLEHLIDVDRPAWLLPDKENWKKIRECARSGCGPEGGVRPEKTSWWKKPAHKTQVLLTCAFAFLFSLVVIAKSVQGNNVDVDGGLKTINVGWKVENNRTR